MRDCRIRTARIASPDFRMGFAGLPWEFERQMGLGRPPTGSALNHLVTAVSVKKALMGRLQSPAAGRPDDRHSGVTRSGEPGISRFPDAQLRVRGLVRSLSAGGAKRPPASAPPLRTHNS